MISSYLGKLHRVMGPFRVKGIRAHEWGNMSIARN